jgi:uncharacterized membrane protein YbjE (DUF340 family)
MWLILTFLIIGGLSGFLLRDIRGLNFYSEKITSYLIYFLLFFMGMSVGINPEIMENLYHLGLEALLISLFTITGSVVLAFLLYKITFRN